MKPSYYMKDNVLDLWGDSNVHVYDIWRVTAKTGLFRYLRESRLLVARIPNDYNDDTRNLANATLAKFRSAAS